MPAPSTLAKPLKRLAAALLLALGLLVPAGAASAQTEISLPLSRLVGMSDPALLRTEWYGFSFEMPALWGVEIASARMELVFGNLDAAWQERWGKGIAVRFSDNDVTLGSADLEPGRFAYTTVFSRVPQRGNAVRFELVDLGRFCADAWDFFSGVDMTASRMVLTLNDAAGFLLPSIEGLMGPVMGYDAPLRIWSPHGLNSDLQLLWGGLIAQGWALRDRDRLPVVEVGKLPIGGNRAFKMLPQVDVDEMAPGAHVIVGTVDELELYVSERLLSEVTGPYIRVVTNNDGPFQAFILVSGRDAREVVTAARVLGTPGFSWPLASGVVLMPEGDPVQAALAGSHEIPRVLWGAKDDSLDVATRSFEELGRPTATYRGSMLPEIVLPIVTSDLDETHQGAVELDLAYAYGSGFDQASAWNVMLGDRFVGSIGANDPGGSDQVHGRISIPVAELEPGINLLRLSARFAPLGWDRCQRLDDRNLVATVYGSSQITVPYLGGGQTQRSLANWALTGLFNPSRGYRPTSWALASHGDAVVGAALTLVAKQAQMLGRPLTETSISYSWDIQNRDAVVIGASRDVDNLLNGRSFIAEDEPAAKSGGTLERLTDFLDRSAMAGSESARLKEIAAFIESARKTNGMAAGATEIFGFMDEAGFARVVIAVEDEQRIGADVAALVEPRSWYDLAGDAAAFDPASGRIASGTVVDPGERIDPAEDLLGSVTEWIATNGKATPWKWMAIAFAIIILFAAVTRMSLSGRRRREKWGRND